MTRFLTVEEVRVIHQRMIARFGGSEGLRDAGLLEAAVMQPQATFGGEDLYPEFHHKAAALAYSLASNHPFIDGNKRVAHAAMEVFLLLNGHEVADDVDSQETLFLRLAAGEVSREDLIEWLGSHIRPIEASD